MKVISFSLITKAHTRVGIEQLHNDLLVVNTEMLVVNTEMLSNDLLVVNTERVPTLSVLTTSRSLLSISPLIVES